MPAVDGGRTRGREGHVRSGCRSVSTGLATDTVHTEVVARVATEEDVLVALELALAEHGETELGQCGYVHSPARRKVAHPDTHVIDHPAHAFESIQRARVRLRVPRARNPNGRSER